MSSISNLNLSLTQLEFKFKSEPKLNFLSRKWNIVIAMYNDAWQYVEYDEIEKRKVKYKLGDLCQQPE